MDPPRRQLQADRRSPLSTASSCRSPRSGRQRRQSERQVAELGDCIEALEHDLGFVSLVLASVMAKLDEQGTLTRADLKAAMQELDGIDGVADGRLDINVLKGMQS